MDPRSLVTRDLAESGRKFLLRLAKTDAAPIAAMWAQRSEHDDRPYLFVVVPLIESQGPIRAYTIAGNVQRELNAETNDIFAELDAFAVKLLGPSEPLAKGLLDWYQRYPDDRPTFHHGSSLGFVPIDGAYIYPATMFSVPVAQPSST
jgi:hypothetical protein